MLKMIVQHRRGTTAEWKLSTIIPLEGELLIEETVSDGIKLKIGDGKSGFLGLPYITDLLSDKITATEKELKNVQSTVTDNEVIRKLKKDLSDLDTDINLLNRELVKVQKNVGDKTINPETNEITYSGIHAQLQTIRNSVNMLSNRISGFTSLEEGSVTGDAELLDIRHGFNGIDYSSAGDAVRAIGDELQAFKDALPSFIPDNAVDGLSYENNKLFLTSQGNQVGDAVTITGGGAGGSASSTIITLKNNEGTTSNMSVSKGTKVEISFNFSSIEEGVPTGDGVYNLEVNSNPVETNVQLPQGNKTIDLTKYLKAGVNRVKLTCFDYTGSYKSLAYTINLIELSIDSSFGPNINDITIFEAANPEENFVSVNYNYTTYGQVTKIAHFILDDQEITNAEGKPLIQSLGAGEKSSSIKFKIYRHGCHKFQVYLTATVNNKTIESNRLTYNILCNLPDPEATRHPAMIDSVFEITKATQGDLLEIPYRVYDPNTGQVTVNLLVGSGTKDNYIIDEKFSREEFVGRTKQKWSIKNYPIGNTVFIIKCAYQVYNEEGILTTYYAEKIHEIFVEALDIPVEAETANLQLWLSANGRSNTELNPAMWEYTQTIETANGIEELDTIRTTFSNFNWVNNGWLSDVNGDTCLRLNGAAKAVIDIKPFEKNFVNTGKTFEFDFVIRDVNNRDSTVINCFSGNRGFKATADTFTFRSESVQMSCNYKDVTYLTKLNDKTQKEETIEQLERTRISITIAPSSLVADNAPDLNTYFISMYINGILSSCQKYGGIDEGFVQSNPVKISLGSEDCGLDLYNIRIYDSALSHKGIVDNYIADSANGPDKIDLYRENNIYYADSELSDQISYESLKGKIPIVTFTGRMPTYKGDKKANSVLMKFEHPEHPELNFEEVLKEIDVQGTSSQFYIRKNWKTKHYDKHTHMIGEIPTKVFCLKVDYAEATGTHNTQAANFVETLYNRSENLLPPQEKDSRVRSTITGFPCVIFEKETASSRPIFSAKANFNFDKGSEEAFGFTEDYDVESWEFCNNTSGACNFLEKINTEAWAAVYRLSGAAEDTSISITANSPEEAESIARDLLATKSSEDSQWVNAKYVGVHPYWLTDFEARYAQNTMKYSDGSTFEFDGDEMFSIDRFKEMHDWVCDTATVMYAKPEAKDDYWWVGNKNTGFEVLKDEDGNIIQPEIIEDEATKSKNWFINGIDSEISSLDIVPITVFPLPEPVTIGTTVYEEDNVDYRRAKFLKEFTNYFDLYYAAIYYVYTFVALMTDQRAKNMFLTYWGETGKWYPYFYDNDTSFGINNEGALVFDYYHEDIDKLDGALVYNGQNSALWTNFRENFENTIFETYRDLRNDGKLDYEKFVEQFINCGAKKWSASIYNADAEYKYVSMARPDNLGNFDAANLYQVKGSAEQHFKYFVANRLKYCDSKWNCGDYPDDKIFLRIYTPSTGENAILNEPRQIDGYWWIDDVNTGYLVNTDSSGQTIVPEISENNTWILNKGLEEQEIDTEIEVRYGKVDLAVAPNANISLKTFSDMYAGVKYKANGTLLRKRVKKNVMLTGKDAFIPPKSANGLSEVFNDTETAIYGASEISSLGDLSGLYCGVIDVSKATKLTELKIGNSTTGYFNDNFRDIQLGNNRLLKKIDLTNCRGLGIAGKSPQKSLNVSGCPNIEEILVKGTSLESINLPASGYITKLELPNTITGLNIRNQMYLTNSGILLDDYSNLKKLRIENCKNIDTLALLRNCIDSSNNFTVERVKLTGIDWTFDDPEFLLSLMSVKGMDANGLDTDHVYLGGHVHIKELTGAQYTQIFDYYNNYHTNESLLRITFDRMTSYVSFYTNVKDENGNYIPFTFSDGTPWVQEVTNTLNDKGEIVRNTTDPTKVPYLYNGKEEKLPTPTQDSTIEFSYTFNGWTRTPNAPAQVDALLDVTGDRSVYNAYVKTINKYPVKFYTYGWDGPDLLYTVMTNYGEVAEYSGDTALLVKGNTSVPERYEFVGWSPEPLVKPTTFDEVIKTYAQFNLVDRDEDGDISDEWHIPLLGDISYSVDDTSKKMNITAYYNTSEPLVYIPESYFIGDEKYSVYEVGGFNTTNVEHIKLAEGIESIYGHVINGAFAGAQNLVEVDLPESLTTIGERAFSQTPRLTELYIPKNVQKIEKSILGEGGHVKNITVDKDNMIYEAIDGCLLGPYSLYSSLGKENEKIVLACNTNDALPDSVQDKNIVCIGTDACRQNHCTEITIPDTVKILENFAFFSCKNLKKVNLSNSIEELGSGAFGYCENLESITLPDTLVQIANHALAGSNLEEITIPANVKNISIEAFSNCKNLKKIIFEGKPDRIAWSILADSGHEDGLEIYVAWNKEDNTTIKAGDNAKPGDKDTAISCAWGAGALMPSTLDTESAYASNREIKRTRNVKIIYKNGEEQLLLAGEKAWPDWSANSAYIDRGDI